MSSVAIGPPQARATREMTPASEAKCMMPVLRRKVVVCQYGMRERITQDKELWAVERIVERDGRE
jgi:hypothetical protein